MALKVEGRRECGVFSTHSEVEAVEVERHELEE